MCASVCAGAWKAETSGVRRGRWRSDRESVDEYWALAVGLVGVDDDDDDDDDDDEDDDDLFGGTWPRAHKALLVLGWMSTTWKTAQSGGSDGAQESVRVCVCVCVCVYVTHGKVPVD